MISRLRGVKGSSKSMNQKVVQPRKCKQVNKFSFIKSRHNAAKKKWDSDSPPKAFNNGVEHERGWR